MSKRLRMKAAAGAAPERIDDSVGLMRERPTPPFSLIAPDVEFGAGTQLYGFVNLYGCRIGAETHIGTFVEIQRGASVGARCKISSHTFICEGVTIEDEVFVGHGVMFINDRRPRATNDDGTPQTDADWHLERTHVGRGASIGTGAIILGGIRIGARALIGAGAVVTRNVAPGETVAGVPARTRREWKGEGRK